MKIDPPREATMLINFTGIGTVTRKMVWERAVELALINGRSKQDVLASDWRQAKRELTGELDMDPNEAVLESAPQAERWDPLPGSIGDIVPVPSVDDEDDEGRSFSERLVEEGVKEAEHDQMLQSFKDQRRKNE
jgi:hypothetical protein